MGKATRALETMHALSRAVLGRTADERPGFRLVTALARRVAPSYQFTWPDLAWFHDREIFGVLDRFGESRGFNTHRRFALMQLLRLTAGVPGDTAECGVYKGCSSYIILLANEQSRFPRVHHLFDSFEGLSAPTGKDGAYWTASDLSAGEEVARRNLGRFDRASFYKGWIPSRFGEVADRSFSFVHVDVDLYRPTLDSLTFFYSRLNAGAVFVCDDYGFTTCPGATAAVDEFLGDKPEKMVALPAGGGFFVKGTATS